MSRFFYTKQYLKYKFLAKDEYSLHSPLMFDFFTKGLKKSCKNKDISFDSCLEKLIPNSKKKRKFLFKVFEYFKSHGFQVIYVPNKDFTLEKLEVLNNCKPNMAIVIEKIYKEREKLMLWKEIKANKDFKLCCDFFDFGLVLLTDRPLKKQSYVLRKK